MPKATLVGDLGIVALFDDDTQQKAEGLSRSIGAGMFQYRIGDYVRIMEIGNLRVHGSRLFKTVTHLTLYHSSFSDLPFAFAYGQLESLKMWVGSRVSLGKIGSNGQYLYWRSSPTFDLYQMHQRALRLSRYLDRGRVASKIARRPSLAGRELENMSSYGRRNVEELFDPYVTLAYDPRASFGESFCEYEATITGFALTRIEELGAVTRESIIFTVN